MMAAFPSTTLFAVMVMLGQAAVVAGDAACDGNATCAGAQEAEEVSMLSSRQLLTVQGQKCGALVCAAGSTCCSEAPAALCGSAGSTCCYNPGKSIANLCAPGDKCNTQTGTCFTASSFQCGTISCSSGSTCCSAGPTPLCGSPDSTCCYNANKTVANLCAPGSSCDGHGNCIVDETMFKCGNIYCSDGTTCCDEAPTALCGGAGSTCCYNAFKTVANLCAPGSACNEITGNCFAVPPALAHLR